MPEERGDIYFHPKKSLRTTLVLVSAVTIVIVLGVLFFIREKRISSESREAINLAPQVTPTVSSSASESESRSGNVTFNIDSAFNKSVDVKESLQVLGVSTFRSDINAIGQTLDLGDGRVFASNVLNGIQPGSGIAVTGSSSNPILVNTGVTSIQGRTGPVAFQPGLGIAISGTQISVNQNDLPFVTLSAGPGIRLLNGSSTRDITIATSNIAWIEDANGVIQLSQADARVGIGTTPSSAYRLDVGGNVNLSGTLFMNDAQAFTLPAGTTKGAAIYWDGSTWRENSYITYDSTTNRVSIGSENPYAALDVFGNIRLGDPNPNNVLGTNTTVGAPSGPLFWGNRELCDISGNCSIGGSGISGSGTGNYIPKYSTATTLTDSQIFDNGTYVGVGTVDPEAKLHVNGAIKSSDYVTSSTGFCIGTSCVESWASVGLSIAWGDITGTLSDQTDLQAALNAKQSLIPSGTNAHYYRGDKTWATLDTNVVTENGNLYFTQARSRASITANAPLAYNTTTGVLSLSQANGTTDGYLSAADWLRFDAATAGDLPAGGTINDYLRGDNSWRALNTAAVPESGNLYWTLARFDAAFALKSTTHLTEGSNLYYTDARSRSAVSAVAPLSYNASTGQFSLQAASATTDGYITSEDWNRFDANTTSFPDAGTAQQYYRGDRTLATLNTEVVPESTNLYFTVNRARTSVAATAPLSYDGATGIFSIPAASGSQNGYLTSTDWALFNAKQSQLTISTGLTNTSGTITSNTSTGVAGGQTIYGGTAASDSLTLDSTTNGSKGSIILNPTGGNVGIGVAAPSAVFSVGTASAFQINGSGNIVRVNNIATSFPGTQGAPNTVLVNDGTGNLSWQTVTAAGGSSLGGSGTATQVAFWNGVNSLTSSANLYWDNTNGFLGIGTATPSERLDVNGSIRLGAAGANNVLGTSIGGGAPTGNLFWGTRELCDTSGNCLDGGTGIGGNGTVNYIAKFSDAGTIGDSLLYDNGSGVSIGSASPAAGAKFSIGGTSQFQVDASGNIIKLNDVTTSFPSSQGGAGTYLKNDGSGNLSWGTVTGFVSGSGSNTQLAFFNGASSVTSSSSLTWDNGASQLSVNGSFRLGTTGVNNSLNTSASAGAPTGSLYWGNREICDTSNNCGSAAVNGSGTASQIAFWSSPSTLTSSSNLYWDNGNTRLGIGITPTAGIDIASSTGLKFRTNTSSSGFTIMDRASTAGRQLVFKGNEGSYTVFNVWTNGATNTAKKLSQISMWGADMDTTGGVGGQFALQNAGTANNDGVIFTQGFGGQNPGNIYIQPDWDQNSATLSLFTATTSGRIGIGDTSPAALLTVGSGDLFQVNSSGNIIKLNNVTTNFPSSQGAAGTYLKNDGNGNLSWDTVGGAGGVSGTGTTNYLPKFTGASALGNSLVFDNGTQVAIGTASPSAKFHVYDSTSSPFLSSNVASIYGNTAASYSVLTVSSGHSTTSDRGLLDVNRAGSSVLYARMDETVGIGTTSPGGKLGIDASSYTGDSVYVYGNQSANNSNLKLETGHASNPNRYFLSAVLNPGTPTTQFFVRHDGVGYISSNFGIGDSSPAAALSVGNGDLFQVNSSGNIIKLNNVTTSFPSSQGSSGTVLTNDGSGNLSWTAVNGAGGTVTGTGAVGQLAYWSASSTITANSNLFWDNGNTRLGIGTSSPSAKLDVRGSVADVFLMSGAASGNYSQMAFGQSVNTGEYAEFVRYSNATASPAGLAGRFIVSNLSRDIQFSTNYSGGYRNDLYISSGGSVGIGNANPSSMFSVGASSQFQVNSNGNIVRINNITYSWPTGQGGANQVLMNDGNGTLSWGTTAGSGTVMGSGTASQVAFWSNATTVTSSSNLFWNNTNARLGIGTSSPDNKLTISGTAADINNGPHIKHITSSDVYPVFHQLNWNHDNIAMSFDAYYDNAWRSSALGSNFQIYKYSNALNFNYANNVAAGSVATFSTGITLSSTGNVGIGGASSSKLGIANNVSTGNIDAFSKYQLTLYEAATAADSYGLGVEGSHMWFNSGANYKWYSTGSTALMGLTSSGLGIGIAAPSAKLHVAPNGAGGILIGGNSAGLSNGNTTLSVGVSAVSNGYSYLQSVTTHNSTYGDIVLNQSGGNVAIGTATTSSLLHVLSRDNTAATNIAQFMANNSTIGIGIGYNTIRAVGSNANVNIGLEPKGTGLTYINSGVVISMNGSTYYNTGNGTDSAPITYIYDDFGSTYRPVLQLAGTDAGDNYIRITNSYGNGTSPSISAQGAATDLNVWFQPKGTGNTIIGSGNLSFYGSGNDATPLFNVYDTWGSTYRPALQLAAADGADNYVRITGSNGNGSSPSISAQGAGTDLNLWLQPKGAGSTVIGSGNLYYYGGGNDATPIFYTYDTYGSVYRPSVQFAANDAADNYLRITSTSGDNSSPSISAVGAGTNLNLWLQPKGTGSVYVGSGNMNFYGGGADATPTLGVYDTFGYGGYRAALQLSADDAADSYLRINATYADNSTPTISAVGGGANLNIGITPKGTGNTVFGNGNLLFYPGTAADATPTFSVYDTYGYGGYRTALQLAANDAADSYLRLTATYASGSTPNISAVGGGANLNIALLPKGTGNVGLGTTSPSVKVDVPATNTTTLSNIQQSLANNAYGIAGAYGTGNNYHSGLVWYTTDNNSTLPKAGVWTQTAGTGSKLFFGTSNNYASGITNAGLTIDPSGYVGISNMSPAVALHVNGAGGFGDSVNTANADRALNLISSNAVMKVQRYTANTSLAPSVELVWGTNNDSSNVANKFWDFYLNGSNDTFNIRRRTGGVDQTNFSINANGNSGLGTATAASLNSRNRVLEIAATAAANDVPGLVLRGGSSYTVNPAWEILLNSEGTGATGFNIFNGTTNAFRIKSSGNVGIGVDPGYRLDVQGGQTRLEVSTQYTQRLCHSGTETNAVQYALLGDCSTGGNDFAEYYGTSDASVAAADIVAIDPAKELETFNHPTKGYVSKAWIKKASVSESYSLVGVVSTNPYSEVLSDDVFNPSENPRAVALSGRVPVKVNTSNGVIEKGDMITISSTTGVGAKAVTSGFVVGTALQSYTSVDATKTGVIEIFVNLTYYAPQVASTNNGSSIDWTLDSGILKSNYSVSIAGVLTAQKGVFTSISTTLFEINNGKLTIDENGKLVTQGTIEAKGVAAENVKTENLEVSKVSVKPNTVTGDSMIGTGKIVAGQKSVIIANKNVADNSLVFVTVTSKGGALISVTTKQPGVSFEVELPAPAASDVTFNYWIVSE
jgi:hypothetical protein